MDLAGKNIVVVGLAQTGISVARVCHARGAAVTITDAKPADKLGAQIEALGGIANLELGGHNQSSFCNADYVVMSPGVPELAEMRAARAAGVEVIAEIELAYRLLDPGATLIAITGTNGKSTTTALTGALCEASGQPTFCGGNLGNHPLIEAVDHDANQPGGLVVAEVAGFMLETCTSFRPKIAACLNISEDHLDRYGTMDVYASMKTRIFTWLQSDDFAIANANDDRVMAGANDTVGQLVTFSSTEPVTRGAYLSDDNTELCLRGIGQQTEERYPASDLPIIGRHNLENALAAYTAARLAGVSPEAIRVGARAFVPQKHRMERVAHAGGITYFDDSKGTNVAAVAASLVGFPYPVVLIAGGVDKGGSYTPMLEVLDGIARGMVVIGQAATLIEKAAHQHGSQFPVVRAQSMADAVHQAQQLAQTGDAIVLSPGCSSYDMFRNFEERGMAFRSAISALGIEVVQ